MSHLLRSISENMELQLSRDQHKSTNVRSYWCVIQHLHWDLHFLASVLISYFILFLILIDFSFVLSWTGSHSLAQASWPETQENILVSPSDCQTYNAKPDAIFFMCVTLNNDAKKTKINQPTNFSDSHRDQIVCLKL